MVLVKKAVRREALPRRVRHPRRVRKRGRRYISRGRPAPSPRRPYQVGPWETGSVTVTSPRVNTTQLRWTVGRQGVTELNTIQEIQIKIGIS